LLELLFDESEHAIVVSLSVRIEVVFVDADVRVVEAAIVASLVGFVHSEVPIASRTGETAHVVDGELVSATAFGPMVVFDDQAFRLVAEGALEFLLAGQFDD
jgi:hypothetical protein